jgi:hypothetical protein
MVKGTFKKISRKNSHIIEEESYEIAKDFWSILADF